MCIYEDILYNRVLFFRKNLSKPVYIVDLDFCFSDEIIIIPVCILHRFGKVYHQVLILAYKSDPQFIFLEIIVIIITTQGYTIHYNYNNYTRYDATKCTILILFFYIFTLSFLNFLLSFSSCQRISSLNLSHI